MKFKKKIILQNKVIKKAIVKENLQFKKLTTTDTRIREIERNTQVQFLKIKVSVFNIEFDLKKLSNS